MGFALHDGGDNGKHNGVDSVKITKVFVVSDQQHIHLTEFEQTPPAVITFELHLFKSVFP